MPHLGVAFVPAVLLEIQHVECRLEGQGAPERLRRLGRGWRQLPQIPTQQDCAVTEMRHGARASQRHIERILSAYLHEHFHDFEAQHHGLVEDEALCGTKTHLPLGVRCQSAVQGGVRQQERVERDPGNLRCGDARRSRCLPVCIFQGEPMHPSRNERALAVARRCRGTDEEGIVGVIVAMHEVQVSEVLRGHGPGGGEVRVMPGFQALAVPQQLHAVDVALQGGFDVGRRDGTVRQVAVAEDEALVRENRRRSVVKDCAPASGDEARQLPVLRLAELVLLAKLREHGQDATGRCGALQLFEDDAVHIVPVTIVETLGPPTETGDIGQGKGRCGGGDEKVLAAVPPLRIRAPSAPLWEFPQTALARRSRGLERVLQPDAELLHARLGSLLKDVRPHAEEFEGIPRAPRQGGVGGSCASPQAKPVHSHERLHGPSAEQTQDGEGREELGTSLALKGDPGEQLEEALLVVRARRRDASATHLCGELVAQEMREAQGAVPQSSPRTSRPRSV